MVGTLKPPRFHRSLAEVTFHSSVVLVHVMLSLTVICLVLLENRGAKKNLLLSPLSLQKNLVSKAVRLSVDTEYERHPVYTGTLTLSHGKAHRT